MPLDDINPHFGLSYRTLITMAEDFKDTTIKSSDCGDESHKLWFDLQKFNDWVQAIRHPSLEDVSYTPDTIPSISDELLARIPTENRDSMSFACFEAHITTAQQAELMAIAKKFCADVMNQKSIQVVLTGNAGVGKTAFRCMLCKRT